MDLIALATCALALAGAWTILVIRRDADARPSLQVALALLPVAACLGALQLAQPPWRILPGIALLPSLILLAGGVWHALDRRPLPFPSERVTLTTEDGLRLSAHLGRNGNPDALVIAHSLGGSPLRPSLGRLAASLNAQADPLLVELRGHGASEGRVDGMERLDIAAGVDYALSQGYARIHLLGLSIGAMAALQHASERGGVASVAAISPPGRPARVYRVLSLYASWPGRLAARIHGASLARPTPERLQRVRPGAETASGLRGCRLLVLGCERDFLFPAEDARAVYRAAPPPKKLVLFRGARHGPYLLDRYSERVGSLLREHLTRAGASRRPGA